MKSCYQNVAVSKLCGLFGRTRQSYYKYSSRKQEYEVRGDLVLERVREIRRDSHRMGALKLRSILTREMGSGMVGLGRDAFFRLLRENDLLVKRKRRYAITTQSDHRFKKWPDLVCRKRAERPEQIWVSDITYIRIRQRWIYLCLVTDAYSRKIVGYRLSHKPTALACISALRMAISNRMYPESELMHPFGPRDSILQCKLCKDAPGQPHCHKHDPVGESIRQCDSRKAQRYLEKRV